MPSVHHWIASCTASTFSFFWQQFTEPCLLLTTTESVFPLLYLNVAMDNRHFTHDFPIKDLKLLHFQWDFPLPGFPEHGTPRLCGIVMSVCGAALATFFCGRFESHERPAARLLVNLAASLMAYTARATGMMRDPT